MEKPEKKKAPPRFLPLQVPAARGGIATFCTLLNEYAEKGYVPRQLYFHEGQYLAVLELARLAPREYRGFFDNSDDEGG